MRKRQVSSIGSTRLGCVGANTLIVHGIALGRAQRMRLEDAAAGLIWCPSSNSRLFGRTAQVSELVRRGRVALGTDSRFSGSRDLLCETQGGARNRALEAGTLESLVTRDAAALLRLADRGALKIGARADLLVLPDGMALSDASRADVRLVVLGGRALYADADYARLVAPATHWAAVCVDGKPKMLERRLVAALAAATVGEPGLEISGPDMGGGMTALIATRPIRRRHILLINPTITKRRSARFPFAVLNLSAALDERYESSIIDGNVDRDFVSTAVRTWKPGRSTLLVSA